MTSAKKSSGKGKGTSQKGPPAGSEGNLHKRVESERISTDIADYEKAGGKVEKLGVTRVLQKIAPATEGDALKAPPSAKPRSR